MFEQAFKNIDDVLWKDAGCTSELDYTEQTSWLLFLKYLDALESDRATAAALNGKGYEHILGAPYRWDSWAAPKSMDGKIDRNTALTGDDLIAFVNGKLSPYLQRFKTTASGPNTVEYKIGEIFSEIKNRIQSGYNLRKIIDHIDELRFASQTEKHELSHLYEAKIKNMGNAGRNGGEYYTPRPLIRAIVAVIAPKLGETICDPGRKLGKTNPLNDADLADFIELQKPQADSPKSWSVDVKTIDPGTYDLSTRNPNGGEAIAHRNPAEIFEEIAAAEHIDPALAAAGWGVVEGSRVRREYPIAPGRIEGFGRRGKPLIADYVLEYRNRKLAVVEAKAWDEALTEDVAQGKNYAEKLATRFAYATNGQGIYEIDMPPGQQGQSGQSSPPERETAAYPTPDELWAMTFAEENAWRERFAAVPFEDKGGSHPTRYYQEIAVERAMQAIADNRKRILLTSSRCSSILSSSITSRWGWKNSIRKS